MVESIIALFLLTLVLLSSAQMIGYGVKVHQVSVEIVGASALAEDQMENLRNTDYAALAAGGSVASDTAGFFDTPDVDLDGIVDYTRRWQVVDNGTNKVITVRVIVPRTTMGAAKEATVTSLVAVH